MSNRQNLDQRPPLPKTLSLAAQRIDQGELAAAELMLRQVLAEQPGNAQALHLMGIIAHRVGRTELALELIGQALKTCPREAQFHANRGEMCRIMKRLGEAVEHGEKAVALEPKSAVYLSNLGIAYYDLSDYERAAACQKRALKLDPNMLQALNNMGSIRRGKKDRPGAIAYYRQALKLCPDYLESINNLGAVLIEEDQVEEAIEVLTQAVRLNPNYADAHNNLANAFLVNEHYDQARSGYQTALAIKPNSPEAMLGLARTYKEQDKDEDALIYARKALELNPDKPESHSLLGDIYLDLSRYDDCEAAHRLALRLDDKLISAHLGLGQLRLEQGRLDEARACLQQAMDIDPEQIAPYVFMAQASKVRAGDGITERLEAEAAKMDRFPRAKVMSLHFALGKAYDDLRDYDRAFPHFLAGCRLKRQRILYSADDHQRLFLEIKRVFTPEYIAKMSGGGDGSELPIFVLGMPRSGTTLTETILASHPEVFAAGELPDLLTIANQPKFEVKSEGFPLSMQGLTRDDLTKMGTRYLAGLRTHDPSARRITDKMPANFMGLGLIHLMLPKAKIVHVKRNAVDVCLSAFTKHFPNTQHHSYDLVEMGRFYLDYARLMEHWRRVLPAGAFYELQYEELVTEPEVQSRRLLKYCGLEWNEACLTPHQTKREVKTASVTQVREKVYTSSVERWRHYEQHLQPLLDTLGEYALARG